MSTEPVDSKEYTDVKVQPSKTSISYKTKLEFLDINRKHQSIVSVNPPSVTQFGTLQFLLEDRLKNYPLMVIFSWETEQLQDIVQPRIIVG